MERLNLSPELYRLALPSQPLSEPDSGALGSPRATGDRPRGRTGAPLLISSPDPGEFRLTPHRRGPQAQALGPPPRPAGVHATRKRSHVARRRPLRLRGRGLRAWFPASSRAATRSQSPPGMLVVRFGPSPFVTSRIRTGGSSLASAGEPEPVFLFPYPTQGLRNRTSSPLPRIGM